MHALAALVVRYEDGRHVDHFGVDERLDAVGHRIVRVENVEEARTRRQNEVLAQPVDAAHCYEHGWPRLVRISSSFSWNTRANFQDPNSAVTAAASVNFFLKMGTYLELLISFFFLLESPLNSLGVKFQ